VLGLRSDLGFIFDIIERVSAFSPASLANLATRPERA